MIVLLYIAYFVTRILGLIWSKFREQMFANQKVHIHHFTIRLFCREKKMSLAPQFAGHRWGSNNAPHILEVYLDYVCPFSAKLYKRLRNEVLPFIDQNYSGKVQFIFRQQVQPWHPFSTVVHEAAIAVEKLDPSKFFVFSDKLFDVQKQYYDESVQNLTRAQIYESLASHVSEIGLSSSDFLLLLHIPVSIKSEEARNAGNKITNELKWHIKLGRQIGIHVSPTSLFDGIIDNDISSGWTLDQWKEWLAKKVI